jgi:hypothetical protein
MVLLSEIPNLLILKEAVDKINFKTKYSWLFKIISL